MKNVRCVSSLRVSLTIVPKSMKTCKASSNGLLPVKIEIIVTIKKVTKIKMVCLSNVLLKSAVAKIKAQPPKIIARNEPVELVRIFP